ARNAGRCVRKAGCAGGGVFACGDRCRECAISSCRGGRSRRRRSQAPNVGIQAGKTFKHLEKNQATSAEQGRATGPNANGGERGSRKKTESAASSPHRRTPRSRLDNGTHSWTSWRHAASSPFRS